MRIGSSSLFTAYSTAIIVVLFVFLTGCDETTTSSDGFDRKAMLEGFADKIIIPSYDELVAKASVLHDLVHLLDSEIQYVELQMIQQALHHTQVAWQDAVTFDFGPAEGLLGNLSVNIGTFPASPAKIEDAIMRADTSLSGFDRDARGLNALDYLLHHAEPAVIIGELSGQAGSMRRAYLRSIVRKLLSETQVVLTAWRSGYREQFISRNGTDAGSGTSAIFNAMNVSFEMIKNYKLGVPLGLRAGQTQPEPTRVEAYYSGASLELIKKHITSVMNLWTGRDAVGTNIVGFEEYLESLPGGQRLIEETKQQYNKVIAALEKIPTSVQLSTQIRESPQPVVELHMELQKLTRYLKSELSSLTGISITYSSGDGD